MKYHFKIFLLANIFFFGIITSCIPNETESESQKFIAKANKLEEREKYNLSRKILLRGYEYTESIEILKAWLEIDKQLFYNIKVQNLNDSITLWIPPHQRGKEKSSWASKITKATLSIATGGVGALFLYGAGVSEKEREEYVESEKNTPVGTPSLKIVNNTLRKYEILKTSQKKLDKILEKMIIEAEDDQFDILIELDSSQKSLVDIIFETRTNYLSYDVISPSLAKTQQLLYLSENTKILSWGHSFEYLEEASKTLKDVAGKSSLSECNQDVRNQFYSTLLIFEEVADDEKEKEELEKIQSMREGIQQEKKFGSERWWNQ